MDEDFVVYAQLKGLSRPRILLRYVMPNAMLPQVTFLALQLGLMFNGSIIAEIVFNYPGLGLTLFTASVARDYPVIQGQLLLMTLATLGATAGLAIATWGDNVSVVAGAMAMGPEFPSEVPPHWKIYFAVDDCDAAVAKATELGGQVDSPPMDTPAGRMASLRDPHGAAFAVIKTQPMG